MRKIGHRAVTCALGVSFFAACSGDDTTYYPADGGAPREGGVDATSGIDASVDAHADAQADAAIDAAPDATDAPSEASAADCLSASGADAFFTLMDATKCVVGAYTVDATSLGSLTWGRHGGPLGFESAPALKLVRYAVPATPTGTLVPTRTAVTVGSVPSGIYWGSQALDFPFFPTLGWTAIAYTGSGTGFPGEIVIVDGAGAVAKRYNVNGFFAETAVGLAASGGRLLYTGLSPLMTAAAATNAGGLYAADTCGTAGANPRLLPEGDGTCKDSFRVATWQAGSSGPVAADADGNAFAILSTFGGSQELRGFEHDAIARGAGAVAGNALFTMTGYTTELAADGRAAYFQSNDASTYTPLDVQTVKYTVDGTAKTVSPSGGPTTFLHMKTAGTAVALVVDDRRRLWVGVTNPGVGDAGPTRSTFFVLRDKTP